MRRSVPTTRMASTVESTICSSRRRSRSPSSGARTRWMHCSRHYVRFVIDTAFLHAISARRGPAVELQRNCHARKGEWQRRMQHEPVKGLRNCNASASKPPFGVGKSRLLCKTADAPPRMLGGAKKTKGRFEGEGLEGSGKAPPGVPSVPEPVDREASRPSVNATTARSHCLHPVLKGDDRQRMVRSAP